MFRHYNDKICEYSSKEGCAVLVMVNVILDAMIQPRVDLKISSCVNIDSFRKF